MHPYYVVGYYYCKPFRYYYICFYGYQCMFCCNDDDFLTSNADDMCNGVRCCTLLHIHCDILHLILPIYHGHIPESPRTLDHDNCFLFICAVLMNGIGQTFNRFGEY